MKPAYLHHTGRRLSEPAEAPARGASGGLRGHGLAEAAEAAAGGARGGKGGPQ